MSYTQLNFIFMVPNTTCHMVEVYS